MAAASASSAWAVGVIASTYKPLILRWNGTAWSQVPSPSPVGYLLAAAATSARSAWAVGSTGTCKSLILRWDGSAWKRVASPSPGADDVLRSVAATSVGSAWAVGGTGSGKTLILRWNGTVWKRVPSPSPGAGYVSRRIRDLGAQCLGGRADRRQDPDRAVERHRLEIELTGLCLPRYAVVGGH